MGRNRGFDTERALDAALRTFWERGYEASSIQDLCRAMEVQPGSVYAAFGAKRDLFAAALRRYVRTVSTEAIDRISAAPTGTRGLRDYFAHLVDAMVDGDRRWGCLITNSLVEFAGRDPELAGMMDLHLANLRAAFAAALARDGSARSGASAGLLVAVVQGMNVLAKGRPGRAALESIAEAALAGV